jgi:hypothetical protein
MSGYTKVVGGVVTKRLIRMFIAWLLLATVLVVCVSPAVDLPESALRAKQIATVFFWLLGAALFVMVRPLQMTPRCSPVRFPDLSVELFPILPHSAELVNWTCARLI